MRRIFARLLIVFVLSALFAPTLINAETFAGEPSIFDELNRPDVIAHQREGERISAALSQLAGEAMCPFLGLGIHGAYIYWRADETARANLAWHYQPWCWGIMLALAALIMLNSTAGEFATPLFKKPLDTINEVAGLGGAAITLPIAAQVFTTNVGDTITRFFSQCDFFSAAIAAENADVGVTTVNWLLVYPAALITAIAIWICWHLIDVFVLICPFPFIDALLRGGRVAIVGALLALNEFSPALGLFCSLAFIAACFFACGWCARRLRYYAELFWTHLFSSEILRLPVKVFSGRGLRGCASRTRGVLWRSDDGAATFSFRRFFIWRRNIRLPLDAYLSENKIFADIKGSRKILLLLTPDYSAHAQEIQNYYRLPPAPTSTVAPKISGIAAV